MDTLLLLLDLNLIVLALDHLSTSFTALFFPQKAIKLYSAIFGVNIPQENQYFTLLKPWAALGFFAGLVGLLPVIDPVKYEGILWCLIVLLAIRIYIRGSNILSGKTYFDLSTKRNLFHIGLIIACASMIFALIVVSK